MEPLTRILLIEDEGPPLKYLEVKWRAASDITDEDAFWEAFDRGAARWIATTADGRNIYESDDLTRGKIIEYAHFKSLVDCMAFSGLADFVVASYDRHDRVIGDYTNTETDVDGDNLDDYTCDECSELVPLGESLQRDSTSGKSFCSDCRPKVEPPPPAPAKKPAAKPATAKKAQPAKAAAAKKPPAKKAQAKKTPAKKTPAKKTKSR